MPESAHSTRSMVFSSAPAAAEFLKSGDELRRVTVVILRSMPPEAVYTQVRPRGTAVAYTFGDETPTGLRLHWDETEGVVSIVSITADGEAMRQGLVVGSELERVNGRPMAGHRPA